MLAGGLLLLAVGCAAVPPVQEMSDARQAIRSAEEAGAEQHAPAPLRQARQLLATAQEQLQRGAYSQARDAARDAYSAAVQAREQAVRFTLQ
ncbi:MAG TPA: DUF4398 domain-containing protein [Candidatus Competibacteraceae bacterium]|nr:DUF4398 domain-containing protein [Candidatus Competibacteraceae bacterium]